MVSFSCEVCNDTVKKPKLDQHAGRCRGAYFTCAPRLPFLAAGLHSDLAPRARSALLSRAPPRTMVDESAPPPKLTPLSRSRSHRHRLQHDLRGHVVPRAHVVRFRGAALPQVGLQGAKGQGQEGPAATGPERRFGACARTCTCTCTRTRTGAGRGQEGRRATAGGRAEEARAGRGRAGAQGRRRICGAAPAAAAANGAAADEPAKKKKKKSKKAKGEASEAGEANGAAPAAATQENGAPSVKAFLAEAVTPLLAGGDVSLADVRAKVVEQATAKGLKVDEVESALWAGLKVGGKKQKVRAEFA